MEVENLLKCYMKLKVELRVYLVKRLRTYFLHISSKRWGIHFKIMEVENLLRYHTYETKEVSDLLQDHGGWWFTEMLYGVGSWVKGVIFTHYLKGIRYLLQDNRGWKFT